MKEKLLEKLNEKSGIIDLLLLMTKIDSSVEFKIELNNHKVESDIYGNSIFEIELPEYATNTEITNASMVYGDGLEISNVELADKNVVNMDLILAPAEQDTLVLMTCAGELYENGDASQRLIITALSV